MVFESNMAAKHPDEPQVTPCEICAKCKHSSLFQASTSYIHWLFTLLCNMAARYSMYSMYHQRRGRRRSQSTSRWNACHTNQTVREVSRHLAALGPNSPEPIMQFDSKPMKRGCISDVVRPPYIKYQPGWRVEQAYWLQPTWKVDR